MLTEADKKYINGRLKNVHVMYNPLFLSPLKKLPAKENTILSVGRLDAWHYKGFDVLISAWKDISQIYPDWKLKIIGKPARIRPNFFKRSCQRNKKY